MGGAGLLVLVLALALVAPPHRIAATGECGSLQTDAGARCGVSCKFHGGVVRVPAADGSGNLTACAYTPPDADPGAFGALYTGSPSSEQCVHRVLPATYEIGTKTDPDSPCLVNGTNVTAYACCCATT